MTTYVSKKERCFFDAERGDDELARKRSEGRMKTYVSATDARVWSIPDEQRRQYIIDLIRSPHKKGSSFGKYIPIEVLIDLLLASKNADIERLKKQISELQRLLEMYEKLELTDEQKKMLAAMKNEMQLSVEDLYQLTTEGSTYSGSTTMIDSLGETLPAEMEGVYTDEKDFEGEFDGCSNDGVGEAPAPEEPSSKPQVCATSAKSSLERTVCATPAPRVCGVSPDRTGSSGRQVCVGAVGRPTSDSLIPSHTTSTPRTSSILTPTSSSRIPSAVLSYAPSDIHPGSSSRIAVQATESNSTILLAKDDDRDLSEMQMPQISESIVDTTRSSIYVGLSVEELMSLLHDRDAEIEAKKNLAKRAIEQLEALKLIMEERDNLKRRLTHSEIKINALENDKKQMAKAIVSSTKPPELAALEAEIHQMRETSDLTPEQETEIIKKELDVLKKYCDKLSNIQEENEQLKRECEHLKRQLTSQGGGAPCQIGKRKN